MMPSVTEEEGGGGGPTTTATPKVKTSDKEECDEEEQESRECKHAADTSLKEKPIQKGDSHEGQRSAPPPLG